VPMGSGGAPSAPVSAAVESPADDAAPEADVDDAVAVASEPESDE
jgi:hypothetical protein